MKDGSIYVHVPFCQTRCAYCSFYSTIGDEEEKAAYAAALCREAEGRSGEVAEGTTITSVYFGGGTPTCLSTDRLADIMASLRQHYPLSTEAEITVEANPDDVSMRVVDALRRMGVNRISMGVQSFDDGILESIGRRHTARQAIDAVGIIRGMGIDNVSIDLIYGLPAQDLTGWGRDLETAFSLGIRHLSGYSLSIEPGTPLYRRRLRGEIREAGEEAVLEMYDMLVRSAQQAGFEQYEISNFALPGFLSRHNSGYWLGRMYVGLGPSAHSFDGLRTRRCNADSLRAYREFWSGASHLGGGKPPFAFEHLSDDERYDEIVMTRLRTARGLALADLPTFRQRYLLRMAEPFLQRRLMTLHEGVLHLTRSGISIADAISAELMWG